MALDGVAAPRRPRPSTSFEAHDHGSWSVGPTTITTC
eukprot:CAMPEP_0197465940 /NCGR_PEP_ID=MMETSP1175-20131217/64797_1 /TAXON_ID=1003142 /ORGANISM="Triceratium dubium, Strain CCMP147" /LENGTH=36 /DNA_ID= /DNA_START= /DNA_END= /DNA_ORIENTATION=